MANSTTDRNPSQNFTASNGERFWKRRRIGDNQGENESIMMERMQEKEQRMDRLVGVAAHPATSAPTDTTTQSPSPPEESLSARRAEYCYHCACFYCTCREVSLGLNRVFTSA